MDEKSLVYVKLTYTDPGILPCNLYRFCDRQSLLALAHEPESLDGYGNRPIPAQPLKAVLSCAGENAFCR